MRVLPRIEWPWITTPPDAVRLGPCGTHAVSNAPTPATGTTRQGLTLRRECLIFPTLPLVQNLHAMQRVTSRTLETPKPAWQSVKYGWLKIFCTQDISRFKIPSMSSSWEGVLCGARLLSCQQNLGLESRGHTHISPNTKTPRTHKNQRASGAVCVCPLSLSLALVRLLSLFYLSGVLSDSLQSLWRIASGWPLHLPPMLTPSVLLPVAVSSSLSRTLKTVELQALSPVFPCLYTTLIQEEDALACLEMMSVW